MADNSVARAWMPYTRAAKEYLGVRPTLLREAIERGELPAYRKPITRLRNPTRAEPQYILFVNTNDIDAWIRATWDKAGTEYQCDMR